MVGVLGRAGSAATLKHGTVMGAFSRLETVEGFGRSARQLRAIAAVSASQISSQRWTQVSYAFCSLLVTTAVPPSQPICAKRVA